MEARKAQSLAGVLLAGLSLQLCRGANGRAIEGFNGMVES